MCDGNNALAVPPVFGWVDFKSRIKAYIRACRGVNVHCVLGASDTVRMMARPSPKYAKDRELFGTELSGTFGEPSGWHLVVQTGNFDVYMPNDPHPAEAFPMWRCKHSFRHACRSLLFSPHSCCTSCGSRFAQLSMDAHV